MATLVRNFAPSFPVLFNNLLNDFDKIAPAHQHSFPSVNVSETENAFTIELAAPGLSKDSFKINVHENSLSISSDKKTEKEENAPNYTRKEFDFSSFKRTFTLPKTVDVDKISAAYEHGILQLSLPKKEEAKPKEPRLIEIA